MLINEIINKYVKLGHSYRNAQNLAAEEIVLTKIASSPLANSVTLKGGIVMFNLTKSDRRVTQDIDFDLIRYSIDEESIRLFVQKLDSVDNDIDVSIDGDIEKLHQEEYQGVRVHLLLQDKEDSKLRIKLDIGVHTYSMIEQEKLIFSFESNNAQIGIKVNPCEQIFAEKLISLARLGPLSTRYKDIYDLYYLIDNKLITHSKVKDIVNLFFISSKRKPDTMNELVNSIIDTLNDKHFSSEAAKPASKWINVSYDKVKESIINYIEKL